MGGYYPRRYGRVFGETDFFAPPGPTERIFADVASGNIISRDLRNTYVAADAGNMLYRQAGPSGSNLLGVQANATTEFFQCDTTSTSIQPRTSNFTVVLQFNNLNAGPVTSCYLDYASNGGAAPGWSVYGDATNLDFTISDTLATHTTRFVHGGAFFHEAAFYTLTWQFNRSTTKGTLITKKAGSAAVSQTTAAVGSNLNVIGDITTNLGLCIFNQYTTGLARAEGTFYQLVINIGSATYDLPLKP